MWRALRRGDPRGLEELMSRYTPYVAAVAARVLPGRPQDWEELTADVFLSAWEHRQIHLFDDETFKTVQMDLMAGPED